MHKIDVWYLLKEKINDHSLFQIIDGVIINITVKIGFDVHLIHIFFASAVIECLLN